MVDFKKDTWIYILIAAILIIISIFTPAVTYTLDYSAYAGPEFDYVSWLSGSIMTVDGDWFGNASPTYLFGVAMVAATLFLTFSILSWRGQEFKWEWLVYLLCGVFLIIFSILYFVFATPLDPHLLMHGVAGEKENVMPGFAPFGILIAGCIAVGAFVIDKFTAGRE
ncbi:MAG: hypothetical protein V3V33_02605 [Candidatus Lokiarchaeia archaeon]